MSKTETKPALAYFVLGSGADIHKGLSGGSLCRQTKKTRLGFIADASRRSILQAGVSYGF